MTQFNLLPDIKLDYLKAERTKRLVLSLAFLASAAVIVLVIVLFSLTALQKAHINKLNTDIRSEGANLTGQTNLNDILTIQNQIQTLTKLHQEEPADNRLAAYLAQLIPSSVTLSSLSIDFNADTLSISGTANTFATVNQLADILNFANYSIQGTSGTQPAFSDVQLQNSGLSTGPGSNNVSFSVDFNFDPTLFDSSENITLNVPTKVTTRSQLEQPSNLFGTSTSSGGQQ